MNPMSLLLLVPHHQWRSSVCFFWTSCTIGTCAGCTGRKARGLRRFESYGRYGYRCYRYEYQYQSSSSSWYSSSALLVNAQFLSAYPLQVPVSVPVLGRPLQQTRSVSLLSSSVSPFSLSSPPPPPQQQQQQQQQQRSLGSKKKKKKKKKQKKARRDPEAEFRRDLERRNRGKKRLHPAAKWKRILSACDYWFSKKNLMTDNFLRHTIRQHHGYVPIQTLLTFPKFHYWTDAQLLIDAFQSTNSARYTVRFDKKLWIPPPVGDDDHDGYHDHDNEDEDDPEHYAIRRNTADHENFNPFGQYLDVVYPDQDDVYSDDDDDDDENYSDGDYDTDDDGDDDYVGDGDDRGDNENDDDGDDEGSHDNDDDGDDEGGNCNDGNNDDIYFDIRMQHLRMDTATKHDAVVNIHDNDADNNGRNNQHEAKLNDESDAPDSDDVQILKPLETTMQNNVNEINQIIDESDEIESDKHAADSPSRHSNNNNNLEPNEDEDERKDLDFADDDEDDEWKDLDFSDEDDDDDDDDDDDGHRRKQTIDYSDESDDDFDGNDEMEESHEDCANEDDKKDVRNAFVRHRRVTLEFIAMIEQEIYQESLESGEDDFEQYHDFGYYGYHNNFGIRAMDGDSYNNDFSMLEPVKEVKHNNYSTNRPVILISTASELRSFCDALMQSAKTNLMDHNNDPNAYAIGMDVEYCTLEMDIRPTLPAMIQLCGPNQVNGPVGLIWIHKFPDHGRDLLTNTHEYEPLIRIFADPKLHKVGVSLSQDTVNLARWCGIEDREDVAYFFSGIADLEQVPDNDNVRKKSLKEMAALVLQRHLPKIKGKRRTEKDRRRRAPTAHWRTDNITGLMKKYAANDVACAIDVWMHIHNLNTTTSTTKKKRKKPKSDGI